MYNILIADDKEVFRRKIKRLPYFAEKSGEFSIIAEAQNGAEALEILKKEYIDIVITDIRMPIIDGMTLLKEIKNSNLCKCVILLSEYTDFAYAKQGIVYGAFDYIVKPIDNEKISDVLTRAADFLNSTGYNVSFWESSAAEIVRMINSNSGDYKLHLDTIAAALRSSGYSIEVCTGEMKQMFSYIERNILRERPDMKKFVPVNEICSISSEFVTLDELIGCIEKQTELLFSEMNKFFVGTSNSLIKNMCGYIINNIEQEINLQTISEEFFVNKKYLSTIFKKETGMNFIDYITFVKIERAKMILRDNTMKVYEAAAMLGYSDTEYFSRVFKAKTGTSPTDYAAEVRK